MVFEILMLFEDISRLTMRFTSNSAEDTDDDTLSPGHASTSFRLPSQQPPEGQ